MKQERNSNSSDHKYVGASAAYNLKDKLVLYERKAVKEYWIVDPNYKTVMVCKLSDVGKYGRLDMYGSCDRIDVPLLGDLMIDLTEVFYV